MIVDRSACRPVWAMLAILSIVASGPGAVAAPAAKASDAAAATAGKSAAIPAAKKSVAPARSLKTVDTWGYQLQNVTPRVVEKDGFDILVIDYSGNGSDEHALSRYDIANMRKRQGHADRYILAYLSIGEAEAYRYYWRDAWTEKPIDIFNPVLPRGFMGPSDGKSLGLPVVGTPLAKLASAAPAWLADENPEWRGNYLVRYWDAQWQSIIFGSPTAYLDKIIETGFDGVYLDKIDANDDWQPTRPTAERDMVEFVKALAAYARARQPGFLIVPQNGEELLRFADYLKTIDAIAKEDLLFGGAQRKDGIPNPEAEIRKSRAHLDKAKRAGRPVLVVEYLEAEKQIVAARKRHRKAGYIPLFARRALDLPPQASAALPLQK